MVNKISETKAPRMSDAAVQAKTGKTWKEWFAILDKAGARKMGHPEIAEYLGTRQGVGPWWQQMVAVTYEQARGLREKHQKPDGFQISVSRTLGVPLAKLYKAFANEKSRQAWLAENGLVVRTATASKSMRVTWNDGKTSLEINFYSKGDGKSQVVIQHSKLPNAKASAKMKAYWAKALDRLRVTLED
jgi:activator of Hsp90 ATPase-like protein